MSASDFIRAQPSDLSVKDVIARGAAVGISIGRSLVYMVRQNAIEKHGVAPVMVAPPPAAPPPDAPLSSEGMFLRLVVELGLLRSRALIAEVERAANAVLDELSGEQRAHRVEFAVAPVPIPPAASPIAAALSDVPVVTATRARVALAVRVATAPSSAPPHLAAPPSPMTALVVEHATALLAGDAVPHEEAPPLTPAPLGGAPDVGSSTAPTEAFWTPPPVIDPIALRTQIGPAWSREPAAPAAVALDQFDLAPLRALLERLGRLPEVLTPEVIGVEMQRLYGEVADDGVAAWSNFPKRIQQQLVALVAARARHVQDEPAASTEAVRLVAVFGILTNYMSAARPGYVNGLSRSHAPRGGSWLEDARAAWDVLWDEFPKEEKGEPPNPQVALGALRALLSGTRTPAVDDVVRAISHVLDADIAPEDSRILSLLESHPDTITPALGRLGRFKRLRRALRERAEQSVGAPTTAGPEATTAAQRGVVESSEAAAQEKPQFDSVLAAVVAAQEAFSSTLIFTKQALSSAKDSPFARADDAFDALAALSQVASTRFAAMADMRSMGSLEKAFKELGYVYKAHESATALGKWSTEYEILHEGQRVSIEQHLAVGKAGPAHCLRIHFFVDDDGKRIVVGHVGRHKTNTKS